MMMEELMQEEFQAGKEEGKKEGRVEGIAVLKTAVLDTLQTKNISNNSTTHLLENTSDLETLQKMLHTALSCNSTEEFLNQFNN